MDSFQDICKQIDRRRRAARRLAAASILVGWLGLAIVCVGVAYLVLHPELIGGFASRVVSGFKDAQP